MYRQSRPNRPFWGFYVTYGCASSKGRACKNNKKHKKNTTNKSVRILLRLGTPYNKLDMGKTVGGTYFPPPKK